MSAIRVKSKKLSDILKRIEQRKDNEEASRKASKRGGNKKFIRLLKYRFHRAVRELYQ